MDVEKAIDHLLDLHAKAEIRMDRTDKQLNAIQKLILHGAKAILRLEQDRKEARQEMREIRQAVKETTKNIDRLTKLWLKPNSGDGRPR